MMHLGTLGVLAVLTLTCLGAFNRAGAALIAESISTSSGGSLVERIQNVTPDDGEPQLGVENLQIIETILVSSGNISGAKFHDASNIAVQVRDWMTLDRLKSEVLTPHGFELYEEPRFEGQKVFTIAVDPTDAEAVSETVLFFHRFRREYITRADPNLLILTNPPELRPLSPFFLYENQGGGWRFTWMGWVNDYQGYSPYRAHNWIYSLRHGWMWGRYPEGTDWRYFSLFVRDLGWIATGPGAYPWAWSWDLQEWFLMVDE